MTVETALRIPEAAPGPDAARRGQAVTVPISALDVSCPLRSGQDPEHIRALALVDSSLLPPILVHHPTMRVLDGAHRVQAELLRGGTHIRVDFFEGTEEECFVLAVRANVGHGLPLPLGDRKAAAARILSIYPQWSDRSIGEVSGLSPKTVGAIRRCSAEEDPRLNGAARLGRDGRTHPSSVAEGRLHASKLIGERPHASLREIASSAGISLGTAQDVRKRLENGQDPVPAPRGGAHRAFAAAPCTPAVSWRIEGGAGGRGDSGGVGRGGDGTEVHHAGPPSRRTGPDARRPPLPERLRALKQDPALRSTDMGRALLRLLSSHEIPVAHWQALVSGVPPHCARAVADIAGECARIWQEFAREMTERAPEA
ncbi:ParB-like nuclease domain-containing protein [Streptomyces sp. SceaMP-e96]|uniref:ParB N-terminal domain-containing protein n=1 Tax=unclassified Streptomyces TaxID=2593676 RepID=UPI0008239F0E|nr:MULTISPECIES: ParB N-terminal domain-containing protein [unclassified Streptomyces]MYT14307.1 ParB N-terminal domain-containing protein [Streptomyces sp. SID4951]SCK59407.1 ParB-like nuclease domain-containing protein [Streptomyces sp. SceaMP-e96]